MTQVSDSAEDGSRSSCLLIGVEMLRRVWGLKRHVELVVFLVQCR